MLIDFLSSPQYATVGRNLSFLWGDARHGAFKKLTTLLRRPCDPDSLTVYAELNPRERIPVKVYHSSKLLR